MGTVTSNEGGGAGAQLETPGLFDVFLATLVPGLPTLMFAFDPDTSVTGGVWVG